MGCFRWFFLSAAILTNLTLLVTAQTNFFAYVMCGTTGNYTNSSSSSYANNLNQLLSSLSANVTSNYEYKTTGHSPDTVYGAFLCRGDVSTQFCQTCVEAARTNITQRCPNQKKSFILFEHCMLRYFNQSFLSVMQTSPAVYIVNTLNTTDPERLNRVLGDLMNELRNEVTARGSSRTLFATREANFTSLQTMYGMVQCTPDISRSDCNLCLLNAVGRIPGCCTRASGLRVILPSCNLRYETYPFYATAPSLSTNSTTPKGKGKKSSSIIAAVLPSVIVLILVCIITLCLCKRKSRTKKKTHETLEDAEEKMTADSLQFSFDTVKSATDFSDANKLGEGGFGPVYKGQLSDGQRIAVKRLSRHSGQGDTEFKNEVLVVAKLQHRNLVRLLGFCFEGEERLLIYEFVPNSSLDHFIFDRTKRTDLNWEKLYKIIEGIARGLLYLHEDSQHRIIHRDLKASNVLLDAEMSPKISDFGMARLFEMDQTQGNTSRVVGTYGYMSPEYVMHGHFSVKSDVFSFGVLLLEIITGQKSNSFNQSRRGEYLLSSTWRYWKEGRAVDSIDPTLKGSNYPVSEAVRCIHIGLLCVQEDAADRPTIGSVVLMLTSHSVSLALPSRPAFFMNSDFLSDVDKLHSTKLEQAMANTDSSSRNNMSISEYYPR